MRIYEIVDEDKHDAIGILLYYEKKKAFIIELKEDLDEWTAPLLFTGMVKKQIFTIPKDISLMWVRERIIPSGRQNIGSILNNHKLNEYDEMKFLEISKGRCSQDHLYIHKVDELPDFVLERMKRNLTECVTLQNHSLLCFFADNTVKKIMLQDLKHEENVEKVLKNDQLFKSGKVGVGGYSVNFGEVIDISASMLYNSGESVPLTLMDFQTFVVKNIYDTTESCNTLECSRQNLSYLQSKYLTPVKENVKGNLFLKGDILKAGW